eukprot:SAG31_NODE_943_length_10852_cov_22.874454_7_plen_100_part_00
MYRAAKIPGPANYDHVAVSSFKFSREPRNLLNTAGPKTDLEGAFGIPEAKLVPGPDKYDTMKMPKTGGGKFNRGRAKSQLEWEIYRAKQLPGCDDLHSL